MLAGPIAGSTEADHLFPDHAAAFRLPLPNAPLELVAAQVLAANALLRELPLDDILCGDARVIHAGQPKRTIAPHAMPANEHIDVGVLEHVANMDRTGDIRRRQHDGECGTIAGIFGAE